MSSEAEHLRWTVRQIRAMIGVREETDRVSQSRSGTSHLTTEPDEPAVCLEIRTNTIKDTR